MSDHSIRWNDLSASAWDALADTVDAPLQQRWVWGAAHAARGTGVHRLLALADGRPIALAQALSRRIVGVYRVSLVSRGPLWLCPPTDASRSAVAQALRRGPPGAPFRAVLHTAADNDPGQTDLDGFAPLMTEATVAEIDLSRGPAAARAAMDGKWRNRLKAAERRAIATGAAIPTPVVLGDVLQREAAVQKARRYRNIPAALVRALAAADPGAMCLRRAGPPDAPVAQMLFLRHGSSATYLLGWSDDRGREAGAHNLLLWQEMADGMTAGRHVLDLGLLDTETTPGLARFKLGAGARPRVLGGTQVAWGLGPAPVATARAA